MGNVNMEAKQIHYRNNKKPAVHNVDNALDRLFDSSDALVSDINDLTESVYNKADKSDIAPTFSAETAYFVGDLVYESGKLWRFTVNHAAGEWNQEEVAAVKISDDLDALKSGLTNVKNSISPVGNSIYTGDLNDITDTCNIVTTGINCPVAGIFNLHTMRTMSSQNDIIATQIAVSIYGDYIGHVYIRTFWNTWSSWREITTSALT